MLDFKLENDKERAYFEQDFSDVNELLHRIRTSLVDGSSLSISGLDLPVNYDRSETLVYITLFNAGKNSYVTGVKELI